MKRETMIWTIVFFVGLGLLAIRAMMGGGLFGTAYVKVSERSYA